MRLWSLHPKHLDRQGLLAVWREALLGQAVLRGRTRGYRHHPQLNRFRSHPAPLQAINAYLYSIFLEATERGYRFNYKKVRKPAAEIDLIPVQKGQLEYEWEHLKTKLTDRDKTRYDQMSDATKEPHPLFRVVPGGIENWERL